MPGYQDWLNNQRSYEKVRNANESYIASPADLLKAGAAGAAWGAASGGITGAMAGGVGAGPGAIAGAVGGLVGGIVQNEQNRKQAGEAHDWAVEDAAVNRAWQEQMANSAHQRQVKDLRAAGLNPILSANAGAGTGSGAMPSVSTPVMQDSLGKAVTTSLDVWHLSQDFSALPVLNSSFIQDNPPIDRIKALGDDYPDFLFDSYFYYVVIFTPALSHSSGALKRVMEAPDYTRQPEDWNEVI